MKILSFLFSFLLSLLLIGVAFWLLGKLFPWYMGLKGFWFYFLMFCFAILTYRFFFTNFALFRLRKTIINLLGNSFLKWLRVIILILFSLSGCIYVINSWILNPGYSTWEFIGYWVFVLLIVQLTLNLIFQLSSGGE